MAQKPTMESQLARLRAIDGEGQLSEEQIAEIRKLLTSGSAPVIAKAASVVGKRRIAALAGDVAKQLVALMDKGTAADKGCIAKIALAETLNTLEYVGHEEFLRGIAYVQREPSYGGATDTAARVRGECAVGLARRGIRRSITGWQSFWPTTRPRLATGRSAHWRMWGRRRAKSC